MVKSVLRYIYIHTYTYSKCDIYIYRAMDAMTEFAAKKFPEQNLHLDYYTMTGRFIYVCIL